MEIYFFMLRWLILIIILVSKVKSILVGEKSFRSNPYSPSPYNLEDYCTNSEGKADFFIEPWKGAIVQVGYINTTKGFPKSRNIHKCLVNIKTAKGWSLVAAIEHMKIRGIKNTYNKWECSDYIQFYSIGDGLVRKFLTFLDLHIFSSKSSEELCGDKILDGNRPLPIYDLSTDANSFHTSSNEMLMVFHQDNDDRLTANNSIKIVFTTFKHAREQVFAAECHNKQKCYGKDIFCIDKSFICDSHVNCAFPGSATDERLCLAENSRNTVFTMTSIIIIALISMVIMGLIICIISTVVCKVKSRLMGNNRSASAAFSNVPTSPQPSAPNNELEEPLPTYETVILGDSSMDKTLANMTEGELPPQYESLFPDGPPVLKDETEKDPVR